MTTLKRLQNALDTKTQKNNMADYYKSLPHWAKIAIKANLNEIVERLINGEYFDIEIKNRLRIGSSYSSVWKHYGQKYIANVYCPTITFESEEGAVYEGDDVLCNVICVDNSVPIYDRGKKEYERNLAEC